MLIEIDRSMSEFDRVGSAIDFRGSFCSRAGGFAPPPPSLFATAIASMIGTTATARAAQWPTTAVVSRCEPAPTMRRAANQCDYAPISVKVSVYTETAATGPWTTFAARLTLPSRINVCAPP